MKIVIESNSKELLEEIAEAMENNPYLESSFADVDLTYRNINVNRQEDVITINIE